MPSSWDLKSSVSNGNVNLNTPQNIKIELVSAPTLSIVSRSEMKTYLKLGSDTTDDSLVDDLIASAIGVVEKECGGIAICQQTWRQYQKGGIETIRLQREPLIGVPTVSYYSDFDTVTATNITYTTYVRAVQNELFHTDGYFEQGRDGDGYIITYDAGMYTTSTYTASNDPKLKQLKTAVFRIGAWLYEQREENITDIKENNWSVTYDNKELPMGIKRLLMPLHTGRGII
jgi:uncharacterized phiE125 gp8 family phage protein